MAECVVRRGNVHVPAVTSAPAAKGIWMSAPLICTIVQILQFVWIWLGGIIVNASPAIEVLWMTIISEGTVKVNAIYKR